MDTTTLPYLFLLIGALVCLIGWLVFKLMRECEKRATAEARLAGQQHAEQEKLDIYNQVQHKLSDTFKALSADALKNSSQSFLELATARLEKFQEGAQGDLLMRQKAIDQLIKPIKESLDKVDLKIVELEKARTTAYVSLSRTGVCSGQKPKSASARDREPIKGATHAHVRGRWGRSS